MTDEKTIQSHESAETAAHYVEAIVKHDAELAAQPVQPYRARRSLAPLLAVLLPVMMGLTGFNAYVATHNSDVFDESEREAAVYFELMLARADVDAYRDSTGQLPASLGLLGLEGVGLQYVPLDSGYELSAAVGDSVIRYRGGGDMSTIESAFESLAELNR